MLSPKGLASVMVLTVLTLLCSGSVAESPRTSMSLSQAIDVSRENNRSRAVARHRIEEARGHVRQASVLLVENPELTFEAGPRVGSSESDVGVEFAVGLEQSFALGRRARIDIAQAKADSATANADDVQRVLDHAVAVAFYILLASQEQQLLVERNEELARDFVHGCEASVGGWCGDTSAPQHCSRPAR